MGKKINFPFLFGWSLGLSLLFWLAIMPACNLDAGTKIAGPNGEDLVVPMAIQVKIFFMPAFLIMNIIPPPANTNLVFAVGYSLIFWTAFFFVVLMLVKKMARTASHFMNRP